MADEKDTKVREELQSSNVGVDIPTNPSNIREETAAEIAAPVPVVRKDNRGGGNTQGKAKGGTATGWAALALSILSLFVLPILFGAAGIVLGFIARRQGAQGLGSWAIGIGALSIIIGIFILPFF